MQIKELLKNKKPPVTIKHRDTIESAMRILIDNKIGSLIVVDADKKPIGIITERDIFHLAFRYRGDMMDMRIGDHMSGNLVMGSPDDDIDKIADLISANKIRHIPIMDNDELTGIISIRDIVQARAESIIAD
ncbi:MAG: CBS domain-containing protein [candidate division Zixibacteria bacterium]